MPEPGNDTNPLLTELTMIVAQGQRPSRELIKRLGQDAEICQQLLPVVKRQQIQTARQLDELNSLASFLAKYQEVLTRVTGDASSLKHIISAEQWPAFVRWCQTLGADESLTGFRAYMESNPVVQEACLQVQHELEHVQSLVGGMNPWARLDEVEFSTIWKQLALDLSQRVPYPWPFGVLQAGLLLLQAVFQNRQEHQHFMVVTDQELRRRQAEQPTLVQVLTLPHSGAEGGESRNLKLQAVVGQPIEVLTTADFKRRFPEAEYPRTTDGYDMAAHAYGPCYCQDGQVVGYDCPTCGGVVLSQPEKSQNHLHCHRCGAVID